MENLINKYILGDTFDYLPRVLDGSVDLVFTGLPDLHELGMESKDEYLKFLVGALNEITRIVKDEGFVVMCQTDRKFQGKILMKHSHIADFFIEKGFVVKDYKILVKDRIDKVNLYRLNYSHVLIFTKKGKISMEKKKGEFLKDVWVFSLPKNKDFWGEEFTDLLVSTLSKEGDFVVDPFAGRGTVLRSAKKLGRRYFGTEIKKEIYNPNFVECIESNY